MRRIDVHCLYRRLGCTCLAAGASMACLRRAPQTQYVLATMLLC